MNLHLHGCTDISSANQLCDLGLTAPVTIDLFGTGGSPLRFDALELELSGHIEIGRIAVGNAIKHRFVQAAFARMQLDQCADSRNVVFERRYLEQLSPSGLAIQNSRSVTAWRS